MVLNVLSLFDGISCGMIALERAGTKVEKYFASEIDPNAIKISKNNYPNIIQLGDITKITSETLDSIMPIDLVIGGSPCQDLSVYKLDRGEALGLEGEKSKLFFHYERILKYVKPKFFLLENVPMAKEWEDVISKLLGVNPILINSNLLCAADRKRLYWTNIPGAIQPIDKGIMLNDVVQDFEDVPDKYWYSKEFTYNGDDEKVQCILQMNGHRHMKEVYNLKGKCSTLTTCGGGNLQKKVFQNGRCRKLTPLEYERLQTLPDNYTYCVADTHRYNSIGNGWTVDVIAHIFSNLKGKVNRVIKCKNAGCPKEKEICCHECEDLNTCSCVCSEENPNSCEDAVFECSTELEVFQSKTATVIKSIADIATQKKALEDKDKIMRERLEKVMGECEIKYFENDLVKIIHVEPTTRESIDSAKLKKELPDVAAKYTKTSNVKGSVRISVK